MSNSNVFRAKIVTLPHGDKKPPKYSWSCWMNMSRYSIPILVNKCTFNHHNKYCRWLRTTLLKNITVATSQHGPGNERASSACFRALQDRRLCTGLVPDSKARSSYCWCSRQGSLVDVFLNVFILPRTSTYSYVVLGLVATHFAYQYAFCVCVCVFFDRESCRTFWKCLIIQTSLESI